MHLYLHKTHGATVPSTVFKKHFQQLNEKEASQEPSGSWGKALQRELTQLEHILFIFPLSWTPFSVTWKEAVAPAAILDHEMEAKC